MGIRADKGHQLLPQKSADQLCKRGAEMRKHIVCVDLQINPIPGKFPRKLRILANAVIPFAVGQNHSPAFIGKIPESFLDIGEFLPGLELHKKIRRIRHGADAAVFEGFRYGAVIHDLVARIQLHFFHLFPRHRILHVRDPPKLALRRHIPVSALIMGRQNHGSDPVFPRNPQHFHRHFHALGSVIHLRHDMNMHIRQLIIRYPHVLTPYARKAALRSDTRCTGHWSPDTGWPGALDPGRGGTATPYRSSESREAHASPFLRRS